MENIVLVSLNVQEDLQSLSKDLSNTDWSAFPLSEGSSIWIPILLILLVFFGFRYLAKTIERNQYRAKLNEKTNCFKVYCSIDDASWLCNYLVWTTSNGKLNGKLNENSKTFNSCLIVDSYWSVSLSLFKVLTFCKSIYYRFRYSLSEE